MCVCTKRQGHTHMHTYTCAHTHTLTHTHVDTHTHTKQDGTNRTGYPSGEKRRDSSQTHLQDTGAAANLYTQAHTQSHTAANLYTHT